MREGRLQRSPSNRETDDRREVADDEESGAQKRRHRQEDRNAMPVDPEMERDPPSAPTRHGTERASTAASSRLDPTGRRRRLEPGRTGPRKAALIREAWLASARGRPVWRKPGFSGKNCPCAPIPGRKGSRTRERRSPPSLWSSSWRPTPCWWIPGRNPPSTHRSSSPPCSAWRLPPPRRSRFRCDAAAGSPGYGGLRRDRDARRWSCSESRWQEPGPRRSARRAGAWRSRSCQRSVFWRC